MRGRTFLFQIADSGGSRRAVKLYSWSSEGKKSDNDIHRQVVAAFFVMVRKSVSPKLSRDPLISGKRRPVRLFFGTIHHM